MKDPTPNDYDSSDGWDDLNGVEKCPHCGTLFCGNGGYTGEVYDQNGDHYEHFYDTDPDAGPFFCPDCWQQLETNRLGHENASITEWSQ
jgi:hypothetical protein